MPTLRYQTSGVCSREIIIDYNDDIIANIRVIGGCNGNLQGISALLKGMKINEAINKLDGIKCASGGRNITSCPDQIAQALKNIK